MSTRADAGAVTIGDPSLPARLAERLALLDEMGDLKRIRVAAAAGSVAERAFVRAWCSIAAGADPARVAVTECAAAAAATRLSGVDAWALLDAGCADAEVRSILDTAVGDVVGDGAPATLRALRAAVPDLLGHAQVGHAGVAPLGTPGFVTALARQPRAGATAPGHRRLIVEPPENHAEHCWAVAVYGALLALDGGSGPEDVGTVFLLGLAHHLHNADLPDAGFAGELALGGHLAPLVHRLTERRIAELMPGPGTRVRQALAHARGTGTAVGAAFHAADVLDRVLQVHHHARGAAFTAAAALEDLDIVHDGPVAAYHDAVLAAAGLGAPRRRPRAGPAGSGPGS